MSRRFAVIVTAVTIGLLVWQLPEVAGPIVVGSAGAACLAVALWLVGDEELPNLFASLLAVPIGIGLAGGGLVMTVILLGEIFPVAEPALLSFGTLIVVGYVGVVSGATLAILGLLLGMRNVVDAERLRIYSNVTFATGVVPGAVGLALAVSALLVGEGGPVEFGREFWSYGVSTLVGVDGRALHLGSFLLCVLFAALGVRIALSTLPVRELLADDGQSLQLDRFEEALLWVIVVAGTLSAVAIPIELALSPDRLEQLLGSGLVQTLQVVTTVPLIRVLLLLVATTTLLASLAGFVLRQYAQVSSTRRDRRMTALVAGATITFGAILFAPTLYSAIVNAVYTQLPDIVAPSFQDGATAVANTYGEATAIVILSAILIGVTGFVVSGLRVGLYFGYLSAETTGYSLASAGLFVAVLFAGTIGVAPWLIFLGIVGALLVWDLGRFGTTLGREIGDGNATSSVEIVHVFGSVVVGVVGFLLALVAVRYLDRGISINPSAGMLALLFLVVGILSLVEALR